MSKVSMGQIFKLTLGCAVLCTQVAFAETAVTKGDTSTDYYTFDDTVPAQDEVKFVTPDQMLMAIRPLFEVLSDAVTLMKWVEHREAPPVPAEPYKRLKHFGTWMVDPSEGTCYNTRAHALMRDSSVQVTMDKVDPCVVADGDWNDPYTGRTFTAAKDLQIDHLVPLKNAYTSGASQWSPQKRCLYANFMANSYHLISVNGHENMSKGDRAPGKYLPPNEAFVCDYIHRWLKVKMIWGLIMTGEEAAGISQALTQHHCKSADMNLDKTELAGMRAAQGDLGVCGSFSDVPTYH